jgi:hypothetical protein
MAVNEHSGRFWHRQRERRWNCHPRLEQFNFRESARSTMKGSSMKIDAQQQQAVIDRFNRDEDFRKGVLQDANQALKQEFGIVLPFPIRVIADGSSYLIEPIAGTADDLSDEELELAAGGKGGSGLGRDLGRGAGIISNDGGSILSHNGGNFRF